jgi:hypothetical protein
MSVARALPVAPVRVLGLIGHGFAIDFICSGAPFDEEEDDVVQRYRRRAIEALRRPVPPELEHLRKDCIERIQAPLPAAPTVVATPGS